MSEIDDMIDSAPESERAVLVNDQDLFLFHRALHAAMQFLEFIGPAFPIADTPLCHESVRTEYEEYAALHRAHFGTEVE